MPFFQVVLLPSFSAEIMSAVNYYDFDHNNLTTKKLNL